MNSMNNMEFSLPPLYRSAENNPAIVASAPAIEPTIAASPSASVPNELHDNPAFRAHLARLNSIQKKVLLRGNQSVTLCDTSYVDCGSNSENNNDDLSESIISFDYRQHSPPTSPTSSLSQKEQLEVAELFLAKLERLMLHNNQERK